MSESRTILVVQPDPAGTMLTAALPPPRYQLLSASDLETAAEQVAGNQIDLALIDHAAGASLLDLARAIKEAAGDRFLPVMFMAANTDQASLAQALDSGIDDFLVKPVDQAVLSVKVEAMLRMRDIVAKTRVQKERLSYFRGLANRDYLIAGRILEGIATRGDLWLLPVEHYTRPLETFTGDLVMATHLPSSRLRLFVGDFSGHGLSAAVAAIPVSEGFYTLSSQGLPIEAVVRDINERLRRLMGRDQFLSACVIDVDIDSGELLCWNGGIPEPLVVSADGTIRARLPSQHLPIGVTSSETMAVGTNRLVLSPGDRLLVYTDGVIEAAEPDGSMFGAERVAEVMRHLAPGADSTAAVAEAMSAFQQGSSQNDDVTMFGLCFDEGLRRAARAIAANQPSGQTKELSLEFLLDASALRSSDPAEPILAVLERCPGLKSDATALFAVIAELISNAIEHGVLRLESALKDTPDGFDEYYHQRRQSLAELRFGWVRICFQVVRRDGTRTATIRVEDSGPGYVKDRSATPTPEGSEAAELSLSGRGLALVRALCSSVEPLEGGRAVEVRMPLAAT